MATNKATMDKAMIKIYKPQVGLNMMPIATQYKWYNTKLMPIMRENQQQIKYHNVFLGFKFLKLKQWWSNTAKKSKTMTTKTA